MKFAGIISSIFINVVLHVLVRFRNDHDLKKLTFSHLANYPRIGTIYNLSVVITACLRMIYFWEIIKVFSLQGNIIVVLTVYLALFGMMMTGVIPVTKSEKYHELFGNIMLYASVVYLILFHFILNAGAGSWQLPIGRLITILQAGGIFLLYKKQKNWGLAEVWGVAMLLVWDVYILFGFLW